jgi:hypothetical protein
MKFIYEGQHRSRKIAISKGGRKYPNNYRGINLLNSCYKIYTKILDETMYTLRNFLDEIQTGFRKGRMALIQILL